MKGEGLPAQDSSPISDGTKLFLSSYTLLFLSALITVGRMQGCYLWHLKHWTFMEEVGSTELLSMGKV